MLKKYLATTAILTIMILASGCKVIPTEEQIKAENARLDKSITDLNRLITDQELHIGRKQKQINYLQKKIDVLEKETYNSRVNITYTRRQVKDTFTAMQKVIADSEDQLFDCLIGNAPIPRTSAFDPERPTILVDQKNKIYEAILFCGGEIYCNNPVEVRFCILRPGKNQTDKLVIESVSQPFTCPASGYHSLTFDRAQRLKARPGSFIGLYINPGNKIAFDAYGTGQTCHAIVKKLIPGETSVTLPPDHAASASDQPNGRAYSFRLFGSTYLE
ncbi:MAG: hypothetical protein GX574_00085 [Lentisphaerae bacterium]|nr:hypothetical protein [Lentisphaerota bacterium]OQC16902.1 MAG: hypothetical protein BWX73_00423 [Lentisphaerae bacterium ADurb.Bin082]HQL86279.1 hypothetical protein [Lentisphaeria bacterium]